MIELGFPANNGLMLSWTSNSGTRFQTRLHTTISQLDSNPTGPTPMVC